MGCGVWGVWEECKDMCESWRKRTREKATSLDHMTRDITVCIPQYITVYCNHIVGLASRHIGEKVTKAPCWLHLHGPQWGRIISHGCILAIH